MSNVVLNTIQATMSSREIAELTGKNHADVMRDIRNMVEKLTKAEMLSCAKSTTYTGKDGRKYMQYELDKDTTLTLLLGYDPVARMKVVKRWQELEAERGQQLAAIKDPQIAAMVTMLTQLDAVKQEQAAQRSELADIRAKLTATPEEYYTVAGYASLRGISIDTKRANLLGRKASKISKEHGIDIGKAHSSIHGTVNTYHVDVLYDVFG